MNSTAIKYIILSCTVMAALSLKIPSDETISTDELFERIYNTQKSWTANRNFDNDFDLERLAGTFLDGNDRLPLMIREETDIPEEFDARTKWPMCESLNEIRDQGMCGSCWAIAAASVMTDRICIQSNGEVNFHFSTIDIVSCADPSGKGCDGGHEETAWNFYVNSGVVSGGNTASDGGCRPYVVDSYPLSCNKKCNSGYNVTYENDKKFGERAYSLLPLNETQMKQEIFDNGPVEAAFVVYEDFRYYTNGVYHHVDGEFRGGHAIKIIGWGIYNETIPYWLCANSWGTEWTDYNGFFMILRGQNECGIESKVNTGTPKY